MNALNSGLDTPEARQAVRDAIALEIAEGGSATTYAQGVADEHFYSKGLDEPSISTEQVLGELRRAGIIQSF